MKEPKILTILHKIREDHYHETYRLTSEEFIAKLKDETAPLKQRLLKKNLRALHPSR
ncbi:MAG: hypothetical protein PHP42_02600 [Bacteroidota bacterium]|nr:hypothetical protein [Bacteroidota bacterium]